MSVEEINEEELLEQIRATLIEQAAEEGIELDEEQLDEISKKTLGSYLEKSVQSYANHSVSRARHERDANEIGRMDHNAPRAVKAAIGDAADASRNAQSDADMRRLKRGKGIMTAVKKLTKESVDEMISSAHEQLPVEFAAAFNSAIQSKIAERLDAMRPEVAATIFTPVSEE
jgi:hypothetical protein